MKTLLFLSAILSAVYLHAGERILIVVTNHAELGETGQPTGYYLSEVAHPWHVFTQAGFEVDFASPRGGYAPMDPKSFDLEDPINKEFWHTLKAVEGVVSTFNLSLIEASDYAAIFFAGGHGTMWDFPEAASVSDKIVKIYKQGGIVGAVCHGPAALLGAHIDGQPLVKGKRVAAFTNQEESAVQLTDTMPFLLQTQLSELGADFVAAPNFETNVVVDGQLVTGQNPASAEQAAQAIVQLLTK
ncbi:MAG TPA: type 1 glutamine amidotransferase domain-containing protein [Opitutae bacterium]|nr:type 1 glutamine amidotransferase domain-containing protein [Opitutae bacterium]